MYNMSRSSRVESLHFFMELDVFRNQFDKRAQPIGISSMLRLYLLETVALVLQQGKLLKGPKEFVMK